MNYVSVSLSATSAPKHRREAENVSLLIMCRHVSLVSSVLSQYQMSISKVCNISREWRHWRRRRLSRLDHYQVDTYSRVVGRTREQVRASRLGRTTSEEYGMLVREFTPHTPHTPYRPHRPRPHTSERSRGQHSSHWAYFRSVWPSLLLILPSDWSRKKKKNSDFSCF